MATVDEILTRQAYAAGDGTWTEDNSYPSYTLYVEPEYVPVTNKRIADFNDQISVRGEQNAQFVGFQLPRYDDGIDLTAQHLYIHYQTVYGGSDSVPCNVSWSDNYIRLCWQVPAQATQEPDRVQMMIYATGTNSMGERVTWKTLPASYTIHDGLDIGGGIPEPDPSWYEQFVAQMEGKVSTAQGYANDAQASKTAAAGSAAESAQSAAASTGGNATFYLSDRLSVPSGDYYISGCPDGGDKSTYVIKGYINTSDGTSYAYAYDIGDGDTLTVKDGQTLSLAITIGNNASGPLVFRPMLHAGSTPKPWEPYTGGQPSPSPDYPQPIISTGAVTTGAQLFDASKLVLNNAEAEISESGRIIKAIGKSSVSSTLSYKIDIKQVAGKTVYLQGDQVSKGDGVIQMQLMIKAADGKYRYATSNPVIAKDIVVSAAIATDDTGVELLLYCNKKSDDDNVAIYENVRVGIAKSAWEPYTGGKPSPSPEYPQPLDVTVAGANLLNLSAVSYGAGGAAVNAADGGYTISGTGTLTTAFSANYRLDVKRYLRPGNLILKSELTTPKLYIRIWYGNTVLAEMQGNSTKQITQDMLDNENVYIECFLHGNTGSTITPGTYYPMLYQEGDGTWQPYQSSTAAITLTEPLRGIGDVRDRIMCRDGVWGIERQFVSLSFNGSENWIASNTGYANKNRFWFGGYENVIRHETNSDVGIKILCDKLPGESSGDTYRCIDGISSNMVGRIMVYIDDCSAGGADAFKAYLASSPITAIFERATPTWEPLPAVVQSTLNALTTYTGTTHVTVTAGGPEPDVGLGYVQDTRAVVADLQAQIDAIRNGGTT